jgi:flagellar biosynthesis chaperone FliJ
MLSLLNSEKFQTEYKNYKQQIDSITDIAIKNQLENFLAKLVSQVKALDENHTEMILSKRARLGDDNKDKIIELRKILNRKLRDWAEAANSR